MTPAALAFDLYGTLLDFTSLRERVASLTGQPAQFVETWRAKQLQYAFTSSLMGRYVDFDRLTALALDFAVAQHGAQLGLAERVALAAAWSELPAYADVAPALAAFQAAGTRLAVLSNGTPRGMAQALEYAGLTRYFEAQLSVDSVQTYKPGAEVYHLAVERFAEPRERIGFVSSNGWDATGATEFGFTVFWCNRSGAPAETFGAKPARVVASLTELAALAELRA